MSGNVKKALLGTGIPKIPFGPISDTDKDTIRSYFAKYGVEPYQIPEEYWQQTAQEGRKVVEKIRDGGFVIGGELEHGNPMDGYGSHVHVYSRNHSGKNNKLSVKVFCDYSKVIGSVGLWESWGFPVHPVSVWYQNSAIITESIALRSYLESQGIDFRDSVDRGDLSKRIAGLSKETDEIIRVLSSIEDINLRR